MTTLSKATQKLIKPSDAATWASCLRRVWLDKHQHAGVEIEASDFDQLLRQIGLKHETKVLSRLQQQHEVHKATSVEHTRELMQQGVPVIYQGRLLDEPAGLIGYPDFLIRHESGQYQPADAKLSHSANKKGIQIQLGLYRRILGNSLPAIVFLGDDSIAMLGDEADPLVDEFVMSMKHLLALKQQPIVHYSHSKCRVCPYFDQCQPEFEANQDLSLLYGIHGRAASSLAAVGITTITQFANSRVEAIPDVPHLKGDKRKHRAILQAKSMLSGKVFKLNEIVLPEGTWVHFDIEDNPLTPSRERHVYLWGLLAPPYTNEDFDYVWTDDETQDYRGWISFLEKIEQYRAQHSPLVLAHYSNHEKSTIKKYAERYTMKNHTTVLWLLGDGSPLFDLQKPVLNSLVLPLQGYGLKDICKHKDLVNFQWEDAESGSQWSVVQFNRFLTEENPQEKLRLKMEILGYNRDDVIATRRLEEWLRNKGTSKNSEF
ncbi:MAG: TM0106 family RecB-like putative nuclease [Nitrosomonas sp.]|nr:TM0106 family RecB-like putative nuclease [Nitrosomonas sp.]MDP1949980.1 TM0106 family RecB-like putative nuclease [Nitrosomonas sp.]